MDYYVVLGFWAAAVALVLIVMIGVSKLLKVTFTEQLIAYLIITAVISIPFGAWWYPLTMVGLAALLAGTGARSLETDPPHMGLRKTLGVLTKDLVKGPRFFFASPILAEELLPVSTEDFNWDFEFKTVECNLNDTAPDAPATDFVGGGGSVQVKLSWTGGVVPDGAHVYDFIRQHREAGVKDKFEDRLEEAVRKHGTYTSWQTFTGQKKDVFPEFLNGKIEEIVAGLGLSPKGKFNVKAIDVDAPDLKKIVGRRAAENQQRMSEGLDTDTRIANAMKLVEASKSDATPLTLSEALEIDRIDSNRAKEIILRSGEKDKVMGPVVAAAIRDTSMDTSDSTDTNHPGGNAEHPDNGDSNVDNGHH